MRTLNYKIICEFNRIDSIYDKNKSVFIIMSFKKCLTFFSYLPLSVKKIGLRGFGKKEMFLISKLN